MFQKASKKQTRLRMGVVGPAGSGKTMTAMKIAKHIGNRIAFIDTEHGSASKYAGDVADFDVLNLTTFAPDKFVEALEAAGKEGYDVVVIDSLSHAWMGKDGALEQVDKIAKRSQSGSSFNAWRDVTPMHQRLVEAMLSYPGHLIVTMRSKTEYVLETNERGKQSPRKVGMAPVQRDGMEYEFDIVGDMDYDHNMIISKSRCTPIADKGLYPKPGKELAEEILAWLSDGTGLAELPPAETPEPVDRNGATPKDWLMSILTTKAQRDKWTATAEKLGMKPVEAAEKAMNAGVRDAGELFDWAALTAPVVTE